MLGVHVRLDLEHEAGELFFLRLHVAFTRSEPSMPELRRRRPFGKTIQQFAHAKVVDRGAEEYRRQLGGKVLLAIEIRAGHLQQLDLVAQLLIDTAEAFLQTGCVQTVDRLDLGDAMLVAAIQIDRKSVDEGKSVSVSIDMV